MPKSEITPTYSHIDGAMVHTGYFVNHPDYPLKWSQRGAWEELQARPDFSLRESHIVNSLQPANAPKHGSDNHGLR